MRFAVAGLIAVLWFAPQVACACVVSWSERQPLEFADGSAELSRQSSISIEMRRAISVGRANGASERLIYNVFGYGDIAAGPDFDAASETERAVDADLARRRGQAIQDFLVSQAVAPQQLRMTIPYGRPIFTTQDRALDPAFTDQVRGGLTIVMEVTPTATPARQPAVQC